MDFDLAEIYGYTTKAFNQQVKNNIERFPDDFRFQLTKEEVELILRSKNLTSRWGGSRHLPYAFTEQGVYMLMSILNGVADEFDELAKLLREDDVSVDDWQAYEKRGKELTKKAFADLAYIFDELSW